MTVKNVLSLSLFWLLLNNSAGFGASFENNVLFIPVVTVGPDAYSLELLLNQDGPDIDFSVVGAQEIQVLDTSGASSFDGTNLFVPELSIDSLNYSLTLSSKHRSTKISAKRLCEIDGKFGCHGSMGF